MELPKPDQTPEPKAKPQTQNTLSPDTKPQDTKPAQLLEEPKATPERRSSAKVKFHRLCQNLFQKYLCKCSPLAFKNIPTRNFYPLIHEFVKELCRNVLFSCVDKCKIVRSQRCTEAS